MRLKTLKTVKNYEKLLYKSVSWSMTQQQIGKLFKDLSILDSKLELIEYKKGRPKISQYEGYIVYAYKRKPKIYLNPYTQKIKVESKDFQKNEIACHNQAYFLIQTLNHLGYVTAKFGSWRMRLDLTPEQKEKARKKLKKRRNPEPKPIEWVET